ncbi:MAG: dual specificity protein phosphatase family protein, partial [Chloroflexota bacterium]
YVHCGVGVGRAPSATAAYFIKHENMTPDEALVTIKNVRPFIHLTGSQRTQLDAFHQSLGE